MSKSKDNIEKQLADSFRILVRSRAVEKITIKDITDGAGLIRPTFYNHFKDKYELVEWILVQDVITPVRMMLESGLVDEARVVLFSQLQKDKAFYTCLSRMEGQNSFSEIILKHYEELLRDYIMSQSVGRRPRVLWPGPELVARYFANAMSFIIQEWIGRGMEPGPRDMARIFEYIASHSLEEILRTMG